MTEPQPSPVTFGDAVSWNPVPWYEDVVFFQGEWDSPDGTFSISADDPYWGEVLERARNTYGDPGIRFNTDDETQERFLVYGDGTRVPPNVTYRGDDGSMWQQNADGSVSPLLPTGAAGAPVFPAGYVGVDGQYAPVDALGHQIGPQLSTPSQRGGQPYFVENDGQREYFDGSGRPITESQYRQLLNPAAVPAPVDESAPGEEPMSGATADAIANMQEELAGRYTDLNAAEQNLSEVLLGAEATTEDGRRQLGAIQQRLIEAINDPQYDLDTAAGERQYLAFLREQVAQISALLESGTLSAQDAAAAAQALGALYGAAEAAPDDEQQPQDPDAAADPAAATPVEAVTPAQAVLGEDYGLGPAPAMPDPTLSDLGLGSTGITDPLSGLASALPSMMSALPGMLGSGAGSNPLSGLSGLSGLAEPLAGLVSGLSDGAGDEPAVDEAPADDDTDSDSDGVEEPGAPDGEEQLQPDTDEAATEQPPAGVEPSPGDGVQDGAPPAQVSDEPAPAPTSVTLPDGSSVTAFSPVAAKVMDLHLDGTPLAEAYRTNGVELAPPGTPVVAPLSPSSLLAGDVGVFKDRLVAALGQDRVVLDGQVQPISALGSSPDFLGWYRPEVSEQTPVAAPQPVAVAGPTA